MAAFSSVSVSSLSYSCFSFSFSIGNGSVSKKCCVLNRTFLYIFLKQIFIKQFNLSLICFSSDVFFYTFLYLKLDSTLFFQDLERIYLIFLLFGTPSAISSKISSNSCLFLLYNFIFSSL